ncbi:TPA: glycosyltransferase, partial [Vibrio cholerae]|nr:glycosyltransferase [Vibrio cholerae]
MINLEITIPVLNEEKTLRFHVIKVITYLESINIDTLDITLSIADNGSTDNTRDIAEELEKEYPQKIRLVKVSKKGVGLALKTSWESSNADIVGYMDLDLATDINHIRQVVEIFSTNSSVDIVYGSRLHKDSEVIGRSV